jgi:hypothetical protein
MNKTITNNSATVLQEVIEELRGEITEGVFLSRWRLIETYHKVGELIAQNESRMPSNHIKIIAEALNQKERLIYLCRQFYDKYQTLDAIPDGKAASWHKIVNNYLPKHKEAGKKDVDMREKYLPKIKTFLYSYCKERQIEPDKLELEELLVEYELFKRGDK